MNNVWILIFAVLFGAIGAVAFAAIGFGIKDSLAACILAIVVAAALVYAILDFFPARGTGTVRIALVVIVLVLAALCLAHVLGAHT